MLEIKQCQCNIHQRTTSQLRLLEYTLLHNPHSWSHIIQVFHRSGADALFPVGSKGIANLLS